jgi:hypothetical protein
MAKTSSIPPPAPGSDIERLMGRGIVYRDGVKMLETDYELTITPQELRGLTFEPGSEPKVTPDITGRLLGELYQAEQLSGTLTLVLDDGRSFRFRVIQPDTNEIVGVSWFEPPRDELIDPQR